MNENILRRVKENLNAKFYMTNDTWLSDCVEYYLSEHDNPNDAEVVEFVISQWQLSDLREINNEKPSLPRNLNQQICTTLRGNYILQMEKVYDIAESKYRQLEKIRNISTDNIKATETEATQAWEPKKKRMLHLHLTDGSQNVTAIEYKPVPFLNDKLLPGYKLMIKGPVTCRRGVIMLDKTNILEVGGEVEALLVTNAHENILARALNLPENPDPYEDKVKSKEAVDEIVFDDDFDIDMEAVDLIEKNSQEESTKSSNSRQSNTNSTVEISTFSRSGKNESSDIPLIRKSDSDLRFDMIDESEYKEIPKVVSTSSGNISKSTCNNSTRILPQASDFPDDEEFEESMKNVSVSSNSSKTIVNKFGLVSSVDSDFLQEEFEFEKATKIVSDSHNICKATLRNSAPILSRESEFPNDEELEEAMNVVEKPEVIASKRVPVRVLPKESEFPDDDDDFMLITDDTNLSSDDSWRKQNNVVRNNCQISEISKRKIDANNKQNVTSSAEKTIASASQQENQIGSKRAASVLSPPVVKPPAEKVRCTQNTPKAIKMNNRKITDYLKKDNRPGSLAPVTKICDDISDLLAVNVTNNIIQKTVRSKFEAFDRLSTNGDSWLLTATLKDETASIDVLVSSEILEKMLGLSVAEFKIRKKQQKVNPEIRNELKQILRKAENKLKELDALLVVELGPHQKPKVITIKDLTDDQRRILENAAKYVT